MKITVVTIVYNDRAHIARTIESVVGQSAFNSIEYIIVDGASTDGTSEVIRRYLDKLALYIRQPDRGIYDAMNKGLDAATGDYVVYVNSGDGFSSPTVVEQMIGAIGDSRAALVYGSYRETDGGHPRAVIPCRSPRWIWYGMIASHQSTFYNLGFLRRHRLRYDLSYRIAADYHLTARCVALAAGNILRTHVCVSDFDTSGVSCNNQDLGLQEANRVRREVFGWSAPRIRLLTLMLLSARVAKHYLRPLYNLLRH